MLGWIRRLLARRTYEARLAMLAQLAGSGRHADLVTIAEEALAIAEKAFGPEPPEAVTPLYVLSGAHLAMGRDEEALAACRRAVAIAEAAAGTPTEPRLPKLYELMAAIFARAGMRDEEERIYRRLLAGYERMREPDEAAIAHCANQLGLLLGEQKKLAEADLSFSRALGLRERLFGARSPEAAEVLYNQGTVLAGAGRSEEAKRALERAVSILEEKASGGTLLASALHNLGKLAEKAGRTEEAEGLYQRSTAAREEKKGGAGS
jgi:tetratricopeptide (TPR) repeat protein